MQHGKTRIIITLTSLLMAGAALAQETPPANPGDMTPEQRDAMREQRREAYENMTDEERQAAREKRRENKQARSAERRDRWESMSDEERQAARERRNEHRQAQGGHPRPKN